MRARPFRWLVCLLVLHAATGQASEGVSASERLELARQKLAEQALRASARVDAISWIDSSGRLHEHQSLRQSLHWPGPLDAAQGTGRDLLLEGGLCLGGELLIGLDEPRLVDAALAQQSVEQHTDVDPV